MKKLLAVALLLFAAQTISAQSALDKWPAMKTFHDVMARIYHPAEEGNLTALKDHAETLAMKARELTAKEIPSDIKTKALMVTIKKLQQQTATLSKMVKANAPDADLKAAITEAHDTFHEIVGMCSGEKH